MWKIIILAATLISVTTAASMDDFLGEWTPVANYPPVDLGNKTCMRVELTRHSGTIQCNGENKFELFDIRQTNETNKYTLGMLAVEDNILNIATPDFDVICTHEGKTLETIMFGRKINENYAVFVSMDTTASTIVTSWVYARQHPTRSEVTTVMNNIAELNGKSMNIFCSSD